MKILITSVGSLVGKNLLDVLECPSVRRRDLVHIVGTNTIAENPQNFRCDVAYLVPETATDTFRDELAEIIEREQPDLILNGRDEDTLVTVRLKMEKPTLVVNTPCGSVATVLAALDKWETALFCERNLLPFARSCLPSVLGLGPDLEAFVEAHGFPLIAKPVRGFASKGVYFVRSWGDVERISTRTGYMLQEYLGAPDALSNYFSSIDGLTPLFAHAPDTSHYTCHTVVAPDGAFSPVFTSRNDHANGATVRFRRVEDPQLEAVAERFIRAMVGEGASGPLGIQFRTSREGEWKAQEINMRANGNTYARFLMGQDDIGLMARAVCPELKFPVHAPSVLAPDLVVVKSLSSEAVYRADTERLTLQRRWSA